MAKKKAKKPEKSNDTKQLSEVKDPNAIIRDVFATTPEKKDSKWDKWLLLVLLGYPSAQAGQIAGYSKEYARKIWGKKAGKNPKSREKLAEILPLIPDAYRKWTQANIFDLAAIDRAAIQEMKKDASLAIRHPRLLRSLKEQAGLLGEEQPRVPAISIKEMKLAQNITYQVLQGDADPAANLKEVKPGVYEIEQEPGEENNDQ